MGNFGIIKYCLKSICEIILAYAKARLLFVGGKNFLSENNCLLIKNLIKRSQNITIVGEKLNLLGT